jgi:hypothetical protein
VGPGWWSGRVSLGRLGLLRLVGVGGGVGGTCGCWLQGRSFEFSAPTHLPQRLKLAPGANLAGRVGEAVGQQGASADARAAGGRLALNCCGRHRAASCRSGRRLGRLLRGATRGAAACAPRASQAATGGAAHARHAGIALEVLLAHNGGERHFSLRLLQGSRSRCDRGLS